MKATTKVLAVLWALVLAGLWLPQLTFAGACQSTGECCEVDADCGEGGTCLDVFGVCETAGLFCDDDLDCGGKCSIRTGRDCVDDSGCGKVCLLGAHYLCVEDANCVGEGNACVQETCNPVEACVQDPAATGRCEEMGGSGAKTPCTTSAGCEGDEYCVTPGACTNNGEPCNVGLPRGFCSEKMDLPCEADYQCAHCSASVDAWCDNDSDCRQCSTTGAACTTTDDCLNKVCESGLLQGLYCFVNDDCIPVATCVAGFCDIGPWQGYSCTTGPVGDAACNVDMPTANCITQTCEGSSCVKTPICILPHGPVGACDGTGVDCQANGDCDGGTCVFDGSCTAGKCSTGGLPCNTASDCGVWCQTSHDACTEDADCGLECGGDGAVCTEDADCGFACSASGYACTSDANCRKTCFADDVDTGWPCPNVGYCTTTNVPPGNVPPCDGATTCECKLIEDEACELIAECLPEVDDLCVPKMACTISACTTEVKQRCSDNRNHVCDSDDDCGGCALRGETCAADADCPKQCSLSGDTCTDSCQKVCSLDPTTGCIVQADCSVPGKGTCESQTCDTNFCESTCEPVFVCKEVATGKCSTTKCTRDNHCASLTPLVEDDYTCSGDMDCCTGSCGVLAPTADPQCGAGDCETCFEEPAPTCTDADGDGYALEGGVCGAVDCLDSNPAVNPAGIENGLTDPATCADTLDNNCNGLTDTADSGCQAPPGVCVPSASASSGLAGTGDNNRGWSLLLLAGVVLVSAAAKRTFGRKKE